MAFKVSLKQLLLLALLASFYGCAARHETVQDSQSSVNASSNSEAELLIQSKKRLERLTPAMREIRGRLAIDAAQSPCDQFAVPIGRYYFKRCTLSNPDREVVLRAERVEDSEPSRQSPTYREWIDLSRPETSSTSLTGIRISPDGESAILRIASPQLPSPQLFLFFKNKLSLLPTNQSEFFEWVSSGDRVVTGAVTEHSEHLVTNLTLLSAVRPDAIVVLDQISLNQRLAPISLSSADSAPAVLLSSKLPGSVQTTLIKISGDRFESPQTFRDTQQVELLSGGEIVGVISHEDLDQVVALPLKQSLSEAVISSTWPETISDLKEVGNNLIALARNGLTSRVIIKNLANGRTTSVPILQPGVVKFISGPQAEQNSSVQLQFTKLGGHAEILNLDLASQAVSAHDSQSITQDDQRIDRKIISAPAKTGAPTPTLLTWAKSTTLPAPLFMSAYCAYGEEPRLSLTPSEQVLLEHGFVIAQVFCRGGGFFGPRWHKLGLGAEKLETAQEVIGTVATLVESGVTNPQKVVLYGRSAGAYTALRAAQIQPELFSGVILDSGFLYPELLTDPLYSGQLTGRMLQFDRLEWGELGESNQLEQGTGETEFLLIASELDQTVPIKHSWRFVNSHPHQDHLTFALSRDSSHAEYSDGYTGREQQALIAAWALRVTQ